MAEGPLGILDRPLTSEDCEMSYVTYSKPREVGQVITNLNEDYPNAEITVVDEDFRGEELKKIQIDTGRPRLNFQEEVLQFQPTAELDVTFKYPKGSTVTVTYHIGGPFADIRPLQGEGRIFWVFELEEPITEEELEEFNDNTVRVSMSSFNIGSNGMVLYAVYESNIGIRDSRTGIIRQRDFIYDEIFGGHTENVNVERGRQSDILTCTNPV